MFYKVFEESYWSVECSDHRSWFEESREVIIDNELDLHVHINSLKEKFASNLDVDGTGRYCFLAKHVENGEILSILIDPSLYSIRIDECNDDGSVNAIYNIHAFDASMWQDGLNTSNALLGQDGYSYESD